MIKICTFFRYNSKNKYKWKIVEIEWGLKRVSRVEREQLTFLKRLSSSPVFLTRIAQSLVFCEAFGSTLCLINCVVCPSYLPVVYGTLLREFWKYERGHQIRSCTSMKNSQCNCYAKRNKMRRKVWFGSTLCLINCVVCPPLIYVFWLPLCYPQTFLLILFLLAVTPFSNLQHQRKIVAGLNRKGHP
jgi:hypothetical protein